MSLKLQFDSSQGYQLDAIRAVTDLFEGLPLKEDDFSVRLGTTRGEGLLAAQETDIMGVGNDAKLPEEELLANLRAIQTRNRLKLSDTLIEEGGSFPQFSVEMETGTGKTYVYLRSMFELNKLYGYRKFVIVVPGRAIREGVLKNLQVTEEHFRALYGNEPFKYSVYDSKDMSRVRDFAVGRELQVLIINIEAFRKDFGDEDFDPEKGVLFHRPSEKLSGHSPREFIQAVHPIVIIDEPQSVDGTALAKEAIRLLNPLFTLRYSATHKNPVNVIYRLDPVQAYSMRLVKRIAVASALEEGGVGNDAYIRLLQLDNTRGIRAKIEINMNGAGGPVRTTKWVKSGDDLHTVSGEREEYREGYHVSEIRVEPGNECITFTPSNVRVCLGEGTGADDEAVRRTQIRMTIEEHFNKELQLQGRGIKVLSLFFLDRVANYREYGEENQVRKGRYAEWFEEEYERLRIDPRFAALNALPAEKVHDGYFAEDKTGKLKDSRGAGDAEADASAYDKIMKNKEQLLSLSEPLKFIFSHSALKEGWDNPNVFQICTLNHTTTEMKKRQEIGRGLRLPVNQSGERVFDESVNQLVVIANESYAEFSRTLQREYETDCGVTFGKLRPDAFVQLEYLHEGEEKITAETDSAAIYESLKTQGMLDAEGKITEAFKPEQPGFHLELPEAYLELHNTIVDIVSKQRLEKHIIDRRNRKVVKLNKQVFISEDFKELWKRIQPKTAYRVTFESEALIAAAAERVRNMATIEAPRVRYVKATFDINEDGVATREVRNNIVTVTTASQLPDVLAHIQRETHLKRVTIAEVLKSSGRLDDFKKNPQRFIDESTKAIKSALSQLVIEGIEYQRLDGEIYEMSLFEKEPELRSFLDRLVMTGKSVYEGIEYESEPERAFAESLNSKDYIKLFVKLPPWFKVETPVGTYNPDWAFVKENDEKLYLVRETKSTLDSDERRKAENIKIRCGRKHFEALGVDYDVVTDAAGI